MIPKDLSFDDDQIFPDHLKLNENGEVPELTDLFEDRAFPEDEGRLPADEDVLSADDDFLNV